MSFLATPLGVALGIGCIVAAAWFFVFKGWGKRGSGSGPAGGPPPPPPPPTQPPPPPPRRPKDV